MRIVRLALVAAALSLIASLAVAQQALDRKISLDIPAQPMGAALNELARQAGVQVAVYSQIGDSFTSPRISGTLSTREALNTLLKGTDLKFEFSANTVIVMRKDAPKADPGEPKPVVTHRAAVQQLRLAQAEIRETDRNLTEAAETEDPKGVPEILVRGRQTLNMDIERTEDDSQPYVVFDRKTLEQSTARNLEDFLRQRLTMASTDFAASQKYGNQGNTSSINLRGLGDEQTLILVDGHRIASHSIGGSPRQPDINGIPMSAVERIEVLPATASGIYGGGATGGAINIVLRRDYAGLQTTFGYESSFEGGGSSRRADISGGFNFLQGRTNIMFTGSYTDANPLLVGDRDFARRGRQRILANYPEYFYGAAYAVPLGATTNIAGLDPDTFEAANLTLKSGAALNSPFTHVPVGYAGVDSDGGAALVTNAGAYNLDLAYVAQPDGGAAHSLLNSPRVRSLTVALKHEFTPRLQGFLDLSESRNDSDFRINRLFSSFYLSETAPNNPFNQAIQLTVPAYGADATVTSNMQSQRAVGGLIVRLPRDWQIKLDHTWNRTRFFNSSPSFALTEGGVGDGLPNMVLDTRRYPIDFSPYFEDPEVVNPVHSSLRDSTLLLSGPVGSLPAGAVAVSLRLEHFMNEFDDLYLSGLIAGTNRVSWVPSRSQSESSAYFESRLPLVSSRNAIAGVELLELQLAGRYDRYKTNGASSIVIVDGVPASPVQRRINRLDSLDPTIGLRYQPVRDLTLRASYGTGFLPPGVHQLVPRAPIQISASQASRLRDPLRGNESLRSFASTSGGNPDLLPEKSESASAGLIFTPRLLPGLRLSADWVRIEKTDNIAFIVANSSQDDLNTLVTYVPERITRAAPAPGDIYAVGRITAMNNTLINIASVDVQAYEFGLDYTLDTADLGAFTASAMATRQMHSRSQARPTAPVLDKAGLITDLHWKANLTLGWDLRSWSLSWTARYYDSYWLNQAHTIEIAQQSATIASQTYHDLFMSYRFGQPGGRISGLLRDTTLQLGITNVLGQAPAMDAHGDPFYSGLADPRISTYRLQVRKTFGPT